MSVQRSVALFCGLLCCGTGWAASAAVDSEPVLEEITVTARRQQADLQASAIAVSTVDGDDFERSNLERLENIDGYVPGLTIAKNDGAGRVASIRGVGWETAQNLATQPGVLVYVDGVYLANPLALGLELAAIERIEVHRGPQGTEFGQSATGGAINVVTANPDFGQSGGTLALGIGSFDLFELSAALNLPLSERLALRLSARKHDRAGFSEIRGGALDGYDLDDADSTGGQLALQWLPTDELSVRVSGFLQRSDQHGAAQKSLADPNPDPRQLSQDFPSSFGLDNSSFSAVVDWAVPRGVRLRLLTGIQRLRKRQSVDGDRLTEELVAVDLTGFGPANFDLLPFWDNDSDAFSQEFVVSKEGQRVDWVTGFYYLDHENSNFFLEAVGPAPFAQFEEQLRDPSPETLPPFVTPLEFVEQRNVRRLDRALYGQASYRAGERWAWTLGGRWQQDRSTDVATQFWFIDSTQSVRDEALTWKGAVDLALTPESLLYASLTSGWKNGGGNPGALTGGALDVPTRFEPEEIVTLEVGTRNQLAAGRARINATLFLNRHRNYQFIQEDPIPFSGGTGSIPRVETRGLETEFSWRLNDALRLDGQLTALDGEIGSDLVTLDVTDFLNSGFGRFTETGVADRASLRTSLKGNTPPKLPDLTARLLVSHERELAGGATLTSRLDAVYRGQYQYRVFNNPLVDSVPSYSTLGFFLGYQFDRLPLELSLQVSNLLDRAGVNSQFTNPFGLHTTSRELIPPRQVRVTVRFRF